MTEDSSTKSGRYTLYIDDNFHFMDENERIRHSEYDALDKAVDAAKAIVDSWLLEIGRLNIQLINFMRSIAVTAMIPGLAAQI